MDDHDRRKEYWHSWRTYATQAAMAKGQRSGIPAIDPRANDPKYEPYYKKLAEILDTISSGYPDPVELKGELAGVPEGSHIQYLKTYYSPEHVVLAVHVPASSFASTEEIAASAGMDVEEARKLLLEMAELACIFHKEENGVDLFRHMGPFPGQVAMSTGRLSIEFWESIEPYMAGYMRPVMYDQDALAWRWIPLSSEDVAPGEDIDYDIAEKILLSADRVAVTPCICRAPNPKTCTQIDAPYEVCLQVDDFADFYVKDLKIARYLTKEEIKEKIAYLKEKHLAMTVAGSKKAEIICSCCSDGCCGPFEYYKRYAMGGPNHWKASHYYVEKDQSKCTGCGECVKWCFSQEGMIRKEDGTIVHQPDRCVSCGVCVRACPSHALILRLKKAEERYDYPATTLDLYDQQGKDKYGRSADHLSRPSYIK